MYRFFAELAGARVVALRYDEEMRFPAGRRSLRAQLPKRRRACCIIANPNNPPARWCDRDGVAPHPGAAPRTLVLVDEAYFDFSGLTVLPWIRRYPNLLVARTFSKSAGLAALRLGCLFAKAEHPGGDAPRLHAVSGEYGRAGRGGSGDRAIRDFCAIIRAKSCKAARMLEKGLERLGARIYPSSANFVLADFGPGAAAWCARLEREGNSGARREGIFRREGFVRISAGTRADTRTAAARHGGGIL